MLLKDLSAARDAWLDAARNDAERTERERSHFLRREDQDGNVADFHALRHTFISNLARGGVHPKLAQDLARHSDVNLTLSRYSHTVLAERSAALDALPDLSISPLELEAEHARATGTDSTVPGKLYQNRVISCPNMPQNARSGGRKAKARKSHRTALNGQKDVESGTCGDVPISEGPRTVDPRAFSN